MLISWPWLLICWLLAPILKIVWPFVLYLWRTLGLSFIKPPDLDPTTSIWRPYVFHTEECYIWAVDWDSSSKFGLQNLVCKKISTILNSAVTNPETGSRIATRRLPSCEVITPSDLHKIWHADVERYADDEVKIEPKIELQYWRSKVV